MSLEIRCKRYTMNVILNYDIIKNMNNTYKILAIDDSATNNTLLEAVLRTKGYEILAVESAKEAFKTLETNKVDLILLDLLMPGISGFDFLKEIKRNSLLKNIPVIIISAAGTEKNKADTRTLGAIDFVEKPIDINIFLEKVEKQLIK